MNKATQSLETHGNMVNVNFFLSSVRTAWSLSLWLGFMPVAHAPQWAHRIWTCQPGLTLLAGIWPSCCAKDALGSRDRHDNTVCVHKICLGKTVWFLSEPRSGMKLFQTPSVNLCTKYSKGNTQGHHLQVAVISCTYPGFTPPVTLWQLV